MDRFARWLVRRPLPALIATALVTVVLGAYALHLRIESSLESVLPGRRSGGRVLRPDVRATLRQRRRRRRRRARRRPLRAGDAREDRARHRRARASIPGVERVLSITNAVDLAADVFNPPPLLPRIPPTPRGRRRRCGEARRRRRSTARTWSRTTSAGAAINVFFEHLTDAAVRRPRHRRADRGRSSRRREGPERFFYTGAAHVKQAAVELMRRDLCRFTPIALAARAARPLALVPHHARASCLPLVAVGIALVWTLGVMVLAGKAITLGTFVLPPLLLVVGSSYAIHVMARYYEQVEPRAARRARSWSRAFAAGLAAARHLGAHHGDRLRRADGEPHHRPSGTSALFAVVGVVCLDDHVAHLPAGGAGAAARSSASARSARARSRRCSPAASTRLGRRAPTRSRRTILLGRGRARRSSALVGARRIQVDSDFLYYFEPRLARCGVDERDHQPRDRRQQPLLPRDRGRRAGHAQALGGAEADEGPAGASSRRCRASPRRSRSSTTSSCSSRASTSGGAGDLVVDEQGNIVPATKPKTLLGGPGAASSPCSTLVAHEPGDLQGRRHARLRARRTSSCARTSPARGAIEETLAQIRDYVAEHFPAELPVRLTGNLVLLTGTTSDIVAGQIKSLTLALGVIFVVMALMFLSAEDRLPRHPAERAADPHLLRRDGLARHPPEPRHEPDRRHRARHRRRLDDPLHGAAEPRAARRDRPGGGDRAHAAHRRRADRLHHGGALPRLPHLRASRASCRSRTSASSPASRMATALGANLVLLPALLATTKIITLWDLLGVKLGERPGAHHPALRRPAAGAGAHRRAHGRAAALRARRARSSATASRATRCTSSSSGTTEVWAGERRASAAASPSMRRGDVFGEMALVRHDERSADVVAASRRRGARRRRALPRAHPAPLPAHRLARCSST